MIKRTIFAKIGWGKYANDTIEIYEQFTDSNDYEGTWIFINGHEVYSTNATVDAIESALDDETAKWILERM